MGFVIIPFDYEQLPDAQQKTIVPICIPSVDRHGNPIARIWFEQGVAPVQDQLRDLARHKLGDVGRVSELAEITVHKLWERHGEDAGACPSRRVWAGQCGKRAIWRRAVPSGASLTRYPWRLGRWNETSMEMASRTRRTTRRCMSASY